MSRCSRVLRTGVLAVLVGLTLATVSSPAQAHNVLRSTDPADGAAVDRVPAAVTLTFDEAAIAMGTQVVITGPSGPVQSGEARLVDNTVTQAVAADAPAGRYTVAWRVTSADGHPVTGIFAFEAAATGGGTGPGPVAGPTPAATADGSSSTLPIVIGGLLVVLLLVGGGVLLVSMRRRIAER